MDIGICEVPCLVIVDCLRGRKDMPLAVEATQESVIVLQLPPLRFGAVYKKVHIWRSENTLSMDPSVPFSSSHSSRLIVVDLVIGNEYSDMPVALADDP